jgi:hypothetical protein
MNNISIFHKSPGNYSQIELTIQVEGLLAPSFDLCLLDSSKQIGLVVDVRFQLKKTFVEQQTDIVDFLRLRSLAFGSLSVSRKNVCSVFDGSGDAMRLLMNLDVRHYYILSARLYESTISMFDPMGDGRGWRDKPWVS